METQTEIVLTIAAGTFLMLIFVLFIVFFGVTYSRKFRERENAHKLELKSKELELMKAVVNSQEAERQKLGANLHDEVGPLISALKMRFQFYHKKLSKNLLTQGDMDKEGDRIDQILENVRSVSHALSPHFVNKFGLFKALVMYAENSEEPKVTVTGEMPATNTLGLQKQGNIYRIVLELINNIIKHDRATEISLGWNYSTENLEIIIIHNGKGMSNEEFESCFEKSKGLGLASIKSRVILINAILVLDKSMEGKAQITLTVPAKD